MNFLKLLQAIIIACFFFMSINSLSSQTEVFNFGVGVSLLSSQLDGDNMRGFKKSGYELSLNGGFNMNENNEIVVATSFQNLGSRRKNERIPIGSNLYLAEIDIQQVGLMLGYAVSYFENALEYKQFRTLIAIKANRLIDVEGNVFPRSGQSEPDFVKKDFRSNYLSAKVATGLYFGVHVILNFNFEIGLQNIIETTDKFGIQRIRPYHFGIGLSYYL